MRSLLLRSRASFAHDDSSRAAAASLHRQTTGEIELLRRAAGCGTSRYHHLMPTATVQRSRMPPARSPPGDGRASCIHRLLSGCICVLALGRDGSPSTLGEGRTLGRTTTIDWGLHRRAIIKVMGRGAHLSRVNIETGISLLHARPIR